nr:RNA polymerase II C-terminal domain phosphatase-like 3 [Ipomoea trifida]
MEEECNTAGRAVGGDVEEGEISDSASVEEISEEVNPNANVSSDPTKPARAVQNKPLDELFVMKKAETDASSKKDGTVEDSVNDKVVIDVEDDVKEEGELEEGEIDLDSEVVENGDLKEVNSEVMTMAVDEMGNKVNFIREGLRSVTVVEAEKYFVEVCSKLQRLLDSLHEIVSENSLSEKDALIELFLTAIRTAITVFCSMKQSEKEKHKDYLSRVLVGANNKKPPIFSVQQSNEVGKLILSLDLPSVPLRAEDGVEDSEMRLVQEGNVNDSDISDTDAFQGPAFVKRQDLESVSAKFIESNLSIESSRLGVANSKPRGLSLPLLDLHKDHDVDSLPSPTRESKPSFPIDKAGVLKPEFPLPRGALQTGNSVTHPYETDALKAVSSYQQKFSRSSFFMADRLPSPTPSEDGDKGDTDIGEEISSSITPNCNYLNASGPRQPVVSSLPNMNPVGGQELSNVNSAGSIGVVATPVSRSSPVKIKDPRLRALNSDAPAQSFNPCLVPVSNTETRIAGFGEMVGSRKQKTVDDPVGGPSMKRQRSEQTDSVIVSDIPSYTGTGGLLGGRGDVGFPITNSNLVLKSIKDASKLEQVATAVATTTTVPSVPINAIENSSATNASVAATLQSLLKDIVVNPSIWMNRIKMEQLKSMEPSKVTTQPLSSSNCISGGILPVNIAPPKASVPDPRQGGILQATPQMAIPKDDLGKVRMKPRDPRRALHNPPIQKGDQSTTGVPNTQGITGSSSVQRQQEQLDKKSSLPNSSVPPDISHQFTKNLKNIADLISVSQPSISSPLASQTPSTQPVLAHQGKLEGKRVVLESSQPLASEVASVVPSRPQNSWGDVEHLFEGFDDQQKAAIQRERARRIDEQKKMFAARKLCLFIEVDQVHDEILRKKEELDREKPQRHLFRFPHMGMWTKLRPGIWNFLEKASKLFELHLYTMGNKLYATEMAKLLDPKGDFFAGRVISRGDDTDPIDGDERVPKSKDLEGVLGMESAVVIIDDSVRVWPHNKLNLIVVERYIYFPCSRRQFGLPGPSLLEIDHDERPEDGTLASSLAVIERIHQIFFAHPSLDEADVRNILATEQRKILAGCRILFSRVFPVGEANPHLHPLWQSAEQFGAVCTNQIDDKVTHVVANSLGTDKEPPSDSPPILKNPEEDFSIIKASPDSDDGGEAAEEASFWDAMKVVRDNESVLASFLRKYEEQRAEIERLKNEIRVTRRLLDVERAEKQLGRGKGGSKFKKAFRRLLC